MVSWFARRDFQPAGLKPDQVEPIGTTIRVHARFSTSAVACPRSGTISRQVLSRDRRQPAGLRAHGRAVALVLLVRRFRCRVALSPARVFGERLTPAVAGPCAGRPSRLRGLVRHLGLAFHAGPAQADGQLIPKQPTRLRSLSTSRTF